MALVGFLFALFVLACWAWQEHLGPRRVARKLAREECQRLGHRFGEPFGAIGGLHRNCTRCGLQQHHRADTDTWF